MTKSSAKFLPNRTEPNLPKSVEPRTEPKFRSLPIVDIYPIIRSGYRIIRSGYPIISRAANPCPALGEDDQHILVNFLILGG